MNRQFLLPVVVLAALIVGACQNGRQQTDTREPASADTLVAPYAGDIVTATLTDDKGNTLDMAFDNAAGTATFVLGPDTIFLKQDTTASGIQYSNEQYKYVEHQGHATLVNEGEVVFEKSN